MRFEIVLPDSTRPELVARFVRLTERLNAQPELVEEISLGDDDSLRLTAEQMATVRQSQAEIREGRGLSPEEVRANLEDYKKTWLANRH